MGDFPKLEDLFDYNGSGVMPGRTWIIAPDSASLSDRWATLLKSSVDEKRALFHPHLRGGKPGDKHADKVVTRPLSGFPVRTQSVAEDSGSMEKAVHYGFRSFDRQWIIPDARLINQPNPELWNSRSASQVYLTAFTEENPRSGPAVSFTALIPDLHHYKGSFGGRVFPLWRDAEAATPNVKAGLLQFLRARYGQSASAQDVMAYIAAIATHPVYTARFQNDLSTPGLRIPFTADAALFEQAVELGRRVLWLHTFGERMADATAGRPAQPPRLPADRRPSVPKDGAISEEPEDTPDTLGYDAATNRLLVGYGFVDHVSPAMWDYEVSGKQVLAQWFSYRKKHRERPIIGDRRPPSKLSDIQPDHWLPEYTTELLNVLNVLGLLIDLEPMQAELLEQVCTGTLMTEAEFRNAGALESAKQPSKTKTKKEHPQLF